MSVIDRYIVGESKAIPTEYKGRKYKSRFEAGVAMFLNEQLPSVEIEYEPKSFLLPNGDNYCPDFWIPSEKLWIEARGYESERGEDQLNSFANVAIDELGSEYLVLTPQEARYASARSARIAEHDPEEFIISFYLGFGSGWEHDGCKSQLFKSEKCRAIWQALTGMHRSQHQIIVDLALELESDGALQKTVKFSELLELVDGQHFYSGGLKQALEDLQWLQSSVLSRLGRQWRESLDNKKASA